MKLEKIIQILETWAPPIYQESYDNSGLLVGERSVEVDKVLIALDCTEDVIAEAIEIGAQLVIAHHPILFSPIKRLTGSNYIERTLLKAIKHDIAIYAIHTNLDNIASGVNSTIAKKLGLLQTRVLSPLQGTLKKLIVYVPEQSYDIVEAAIFAAGAGQQGNYSQCGFQVSGMGSFRGNEFSNPVIGSPLLRSNVKELRFETIFSVDKESKIIAALLQTHPYEEVAYDMFSIEASSSELGAGLVGHYDVPLPYHDFLARCKDVFGLHCIKHAGTEQPVTTVAICGGSGSFLRHQAIATHAQVFLTSDFKYHEWFDHKDLISFVDIGHYESEQFVPELIFNYLKKNALSLRAQISGVSTNPVKYYL